jgi:hypothetical protein
MLAEYFNTHELRYYSFCILDTIKFLPRELQVLPLLSPQKSRIRLSPNYITMRLKAVKASRRTYREAFHFMLIALVC